MATMKIQQRADLAATTRDVRNRCVRIIRNLEPIVQSTDPVFSDPRLVMLELVLADHELEAMVALMKRAWWP
jgi:hypothetical protein